MPGPDYVVRSELHVGSYLKTADIIGAVEVSDGSFFTINRFQDRSYSVGNDPWEKRKAWHRTRVNSLSEALRAIADAVAN